MYLGLGLPLPLPAHPLLLLPCLPACHPTCSLLPSPATYLPLPYPSLCNHGIHMLVPLPAMCMPAALPPERRMTARLFSALISSYFARRGGSAPCFARGGRLAAALSYVRLASIGSVKTRAWRRHHRRAWQAAASRDCRGGSASRRPRAPLSQWRALLDALSHDDQRGGDDISLRVVGVARPPSSTLEKAQATGKYLVIDLTAGAKKKRREERPLKRRKGAPSSSAAAQRNGPLASGLSVIYIILGRKVPLPAFIHTTLLPTYLGQQWQHGRKLRQWQQQHGMACFGMALLPTTTCSAFFGGTDFLCCFFFGKKHKRKRQGFAKTSSTCFAFCTLPSKSIWQPKKWQKHFASFSSSSMAGDYYTLYTWPRMCLLSSLPLFIHAHTHTAHCTATRLPHLPPVPTPA